jgi:hypothetical protein
MEVGISMAGEGERCETRLTNVDAQFLLQFADQCLLGPLTLLDLAAGEFPQARHRFAGRPSREKNATVGIDKGAGGDKDQSRIHGPTILKIGAAWLSAAQLNRRAGNPLPAG